MSWFDGKDNSDNKSKEKILETGSGYHGSPSIDLRVDSAYPGDQGGGKIRLDPETMLELKISPMDLVIIKGKDRTVATAWRSLVEDWNQRKARIDNFTRLNAGVDIGDNVKVIKIRDVIEAKRIVLAPPKDLPKKIPLANNPHIRNSLLDFPAVKNDSVPVNLGLPFINSKTVAFKAIAIEPEEAVIITKNTSIEFSDILNISTEGTKDSSNYNIGGYKNELDLLRLIIELSLHHPELIQAMGIQMPKGVLLYGPPGTGKTLMAQAVANECGAYFISITGPEVISKYYDKGERRLLEIFEEARQNAPSIIFIDDMDFISCQVEIPGEFEKSLFLAQLVTLMDNIKECKDIVVIGATNRLNAIDTALRTAGRFSKEIEIGMPSVSDRIEILKIHCGKMPLAEDVDIESLALQTNGFVGADIVALFRETAIRALFRYLPELNLENDEIDKDTLNKLRVYASDFRIDQ